MADSPLARETHGTASSVLKVIVFCIAAALAALAGALVIVEQYVQLALTNRVYILSRGEVIHVGKADELDPDQIYQRYLGIEF